MRRPLSWFPIIAVLILCAFPLAALTSGPATDTVLTTMQQELQRATKSLAKTDPAPYYLSYAVTDVDETAVVASSGSVIYSSSVDRRQADVMMRVGTVALDNTHGQSRASGITSGLLAAERRFRRHRAGALATHRPRIRASLRRILKVKTSNAVRSEEEDKSPDFSSEAPQDHVNLSALHAASGQQEWEARTRKISAGFLKYPEVYSSYVSFNVMADRAYLATSEGTALVRPAAMARLVIQAETRADDGMELMRVESFQAASPSQLPSDAELAVRVDKIAADLKALRAAPAADPYAGPAMLSGRAAAVFFHEVLGHRLEGHRQRDENEGQTFTKKVNQLVLPAFLSVTDDPTLKELNGVQLAGHYDFDDEGVPAARVVAVENGILKNFLMSRMPIKNFSQSNGHGRRQPGLMPTGRQGNLIVTSSQHREGLRATREIRGGDQEAGKALRPLFRRYSRRLHAHRTLHATGVSGASGDGVSRVRRRPPGRTGARSGYRGHAAALAE